MSVVANKMLLNTLTEKFSPIMTNHVMEQALQIVQETLYDYELQRITIEDTGTDYMLDAYLNSMKVEGISSKTLERYQYILKRFLTAVNTTSGNITAYHIRKYMSDEMNRGIKDTTIRGYYWIFSGYFGWLFRDGLLKTDPMKNIGTVKVQKKVKEVFTDLDMERLKQGCKNIRDKAIVYFLKATGCRISEVVGLNRDEIDFINRECIVLGKGNKQRTVYIDSVTAAILQDYLSSRKDDNPALFIGQRRNRLTPSGVRLMLKNLGKKVGVDHVHPHKFRRTEITELAKRGMPIDQIKELAGHEKIDTTMGYIVHDQETVKSSYRRFA